ncbi:ATP-binding protein [Roseisolibacter sp. H3M3-2]|uniref:ATP-binding protein n=1 Tax=Roseisolibacter sp. H3M3-2 TaxID=3031323 RepID=UPI0023DC55CC|nr:ATP-binding protein [Roseisolibacter sp. H3M3-2]MDF1503233.1 ATP-binding protein [Roseisolibacter sp. H3M3-2]
MAPAMFAGDSEMARRCRELDWAATPLGPTEAWPVSLRTTVAMLLAARHPMILFWGDERVQLYNDAYVPTLGPGRHPEALGMRAADCWRGAVWEIVGPQIDRVVATGVATWHEDQPVPLPRRGRVEETFWTYSYGPAFDDAGRPAGVLVVTQETTGRVLAERRRAHAETALAARGDELARVNDRLSQQQVALALGNVQLQQNARVLGEQAEELRAAAATLEEQVAAADGARAAAAASEAKYRALFDTMDQGFCLVEVLLDAGGRPRDYRFLEANAAFAGQTGLADAMGRTARELVPGLEQHWVDLYGRVALTGEPTRFEQGSDAMGRWFDVFAFRVGALEARVVAILFTDRTAARAAARERERLLGELAAERDRLRQAFDQAPGFVAVLRGPEHRYEYVNGPYAQISSHRALLGLTVREAFPELADQGFYELLDRVYATGTAFVGHALPIQLQPVAGGPVETRDIDLTYQPLTEGAAGDARVTGILVQGRDVTELARADAALRAAARERERLLAESESARARAEEANQAKGAFLATMSHELRTPLNAIGGYVELLELGVRGPVTADQLADLGRIQRAQRHLLGLVNGVLNYAKVEAGAVHYALDDVAVDEVLRVCEALVAPQVRARALHAAYAGADPALRVRADREKLQQIVLNLLGNAVKFTEAGGRVALAAAADGDGAVRVTVADTGVGIPAELRDRVFEPFVQVDSAYTRAQGGTGLGLAISRDLARGMGGDLTVESAQGEGSTFTLTLPRAPSAPSADR